MTLANFHGRFAHVFIVDFKCVFVHRVYWEWGQRGQVSIQLYPRIPADIYMFKVSQS